MGLPKAQAEKKTLALQKVVRQTNSLALCHFFLGHTHTHTHTHTHIHRKFQATPGMEGGGGGGGRHYEGVHLFVDR